MKVAGSCEYEKGVPPRKAADVGEQGAVLSCQQRAGVGKGWAPSKKWLSQRDFLWRGHLLTVIKSHCFKVTQPNGGEITSHSSFCFFY